MNATGGVLFKETCNRRAIAKWVEKFDLGVWQLNENDGNAVIGFVLRLANIGAQSIALARSSSLKVRDRDCDVVEPSDHCVLT